MGAGFAFPVSLSFIDWIWRVRGSVPLAPGQSRDEVFERLEPLFREAGDSHRRSGDTLMFSKTHQAAQDDLAAFDGGALRIDADAAGPILRYRLASRALLACFLAPALFLGIAQATIALQKYDQPPPEAAKKEAAIKLNPIDKALGAPGPDKSKKDDEGGPGGRGKKLSPKPAYIFAEIFAGLYIVGRILEDWRIRLLFRKSVLGG